MPEDSEAHKHLCAECREAFECDDESCAEFEFSLHPNCRDKYKRRRRKDSARKLDN